MNAEFMQGYTTGNKTSFSTGQLINLSNETKEVVYTLTPLVPFTVTVQPIPEVNITGSIWRCNTNGAVDLTSITEPVAGSNSIIAGYKYQYTETSSLFTVGNPKSCYIYAAYNLKRIRNGS